MPQHAQEARVDFYFFAVKCFFKGSAGVLQVLQEVKLSRNAPGTRPQGRHRTDALSHTRAAQLYSPALWKREKVPHHYMIHGRCVSAHVETKMLFEKKATSFNTAGDKIRC